MLERLETRRLFGRITGDDYFFVDSNFGIINFTPQVDAKVAPVDVIGTSRNDRILVYYEAYDVKAAVNGVVQTLPDGAPVHVLGYRGNDNIWIDPALGRWIVVVYAGAGDDRIVGSAGYDRIYAGEGNDIVNGGDGFDILYGESGDDSIRGNGGSDKLDGGDGSDTLRGDAGNDRLTGGANPDRLRGSLGRDTLEGGGGRDLLGGEEGIDSLDGGAGADVLDGGLDSDVLRGGADQDMILASAYDEVDFVDAREGDMSEVLVDSSGALTKTGAGMLTLSGLGTTPYTGTTTVSSGTLNFAGNVTGPSVTNVTVSGGAHLMITADQFEMSQAAVHVETGGVVAFGNETSSATFGSMELASGAYVTFNTGYGTNNQLNLEGALSADGAIIKMRPDLSWTRARLHTLITFQPGGAAPVNLTLAPVQDPKRHYTLIVDKAAGVVMVNIQNV